MVFVRFAFNNQRETFSENVDSADVHHSEREAFNYGTNDKEYNIHEMPKNYQKKFNLIPEDIFIDSWNCAIDFKKRLPIQGKLYVFSTKFCFYSPFNKKNIFFGGTIMIVPFNEVTKIEKRVNSLNCNNTIHIHTINGKVIFTSFLQRDTAFSKFEHLRKFNSYGLILQEQKDKNIDNEEENDEENKDENSITDYDNININKRREYIEQFISNKDYPEYKHHMADFEFENVTALEVMAIFFGLNNVGNNETKKYPGALYECFACEKISFELGDFVPPLPNLQGTLEPISWGKEYNRTNTYSQKIEKNPFGNQVFCTENVSLYILSPFHIKFMIDINSSGPPFSDTFVAQICYEFYENPGLPLITKLISSLNIKVLKETMWTGMIKSETLKRTTFFVESILINYLTDGVEVYKENEESRLKYKFDIQEMIDEDPETQIK